ncbi:MAG TPA: hypothetical protein VNP37_17590, partial [Actinomycetospora sp.]|nr:hypothetical protein [Actinomycetospora sp.]
TADDAADRPTAEEVVAALRGVSREVGMEAETVLSPVLMSAPTGVLAGAGPMALGPATEARAPELEATGASLLAQPPVRRRRLAAAVAAAAAVLLVAGSAVAYAVLAQDAPLPIAPQVTTTTDETEAATAPRTRRSTTVRRTTTTRTTTTTTTTTTRPPVVVVPPPVVEDPDEDETTTVPPSVPRQGGVQ